MFTLRGGSGVTGRAGCVPSLDAADQHYGKLRARSAPYGAARALATQRVRAAADSERAHWGLHHVVHLHGGIRPAFPAWPPFHGLRLPRSVTLRGARGRLGGRASRSAGTPGAAASRSFRQGQEAHDILPSREHDVFGGVEEAARPLTALPERCERLSVLLVETDRHGKLPRYVELVERARRAGLAGDTVTAGISGFGNSGHVHRRHAVSLSEDVPVEVTIV